MLKDGIVLKNALDSTQIQTTVSLVNGLLKETTQSRYKSHTAIVSTRTQLLNCKDCSCICLHICTEHRMIRNIRYESQLKLPS